MSDRVRDGRHLMNGDRWINGGPPPANIIGRRLNPFAGHLLAPLCWDCGLMLLRTERAATPGGNARWRCVNCGVEVSAPEMVPLRS